MVLLLNYTQGPFSLNCIHCFPLVPNTVLSHPLYCDTFLTLFPAFPKPSGKFRPVWFLVSSVHAHLAPATFQTHPNTWEPLHLLILLCAVLSPNIHVATSCASIKSVKMPAVLGFLFKMVAIPLLMSLFLPCVFPVALTTSGTTYNSFTYYCLPSPSFLIECEHCRRPNSVCFHACLPSTLHPKCLPHGRSSINIFEQVKTLVI